MSTCDHRTAPMQLVDSRTGSRENMKTTSRVRILWSIFSAVLLASSTVNPAVPQRHLYKSSPMHPVRGEKIFNLDTSRPTQLSSPTADMRLSSSSQHSQEMMLLQQQQQQLQQSNVQSNLPDVSVSCSVSGLVVRVRPSFYGHGATKEDLVLGTTCRSNGELRPYGDLLFTYHLTECDGQREMRHGHLVYKFVLRYVPSPHLDVDIECRFQRYHHVFQLAVRPTWQSPTLRKTLRGRFSDFRIQLMDDPWTNPDGSLVYQLGEPVNIQVSASYLPPGGAVYIRRCYAALSGGSGPAQTYTIIDNFGCLLESQKDPLVSKFLSPRTNDTLRFSISAFQFISDPDSQVIIHCKLFVASEEPSSARKSCTYRENRWRALTGDDSICECCDSQCVSSKTRRDMMGSASSGPLLVSDPLASHKDIVPPTTGTMEDWELNFKMKTTQITALQSPEDLWGEADIESSSADSEEEEQVATQIDNNGAPLEPVLDRLGLNSWPMEETDMLDEVEDHSGRLYFLNGSRHIIEDLSVAEGAELGSQNKSVWKRLEMRGARVEQEEASGDGLPNEGERETLLGEGVRGTTASVAKGDSQMSEKRGLNAKQATGNQNAGDQIELYTAGSEEAQRTEGKKEDQVSSDGLVESGVLDGKQMTWYFTWR